MKREDFEKIFDEIREIVGDESSALISDKMLDLMTGIESIIIASDEMTTQVGELEDKNKNLIKANADLFGKVGKSQDKEIKFEDTEKISDDEELKIEDIVNEKGEVI